MVKSIEQVRKEYNACPKGHGREHLKFMNENVYCEKLS